MDHRSISSWLQKQKEIHQQLSKNLINVMFEEYLYSCNISLLWKKIGFALFGPPENCFKTLAYKAEYLALIDEIFDKCVKYSKQISCHVYVGIFFMSAIRFDGHEAFVPVFRVRRSCNIFDSYFIDHTGRVYTSWSNFKDENIWLTSVIYLPKYGGMYTGNNDCELINQLQRGKVNMTLDKATHISNTTTSIFGLVSLGVSLFPPTALVGAAGLLFSAIVGTPGAVYGFGRSVASLADRVAHDKTINPFSSAEARGSWLATAGGLLAVGSFGTSRIIQNAANAGKAVRGTTQLIVTAVQTASLTVNGIGVCNGMIETLLNKDLTPLDVLQVSASLLFFTHTVYRCQAAGANMAKLQKSTKQKMPVRQNGKRMNFQQRPARNITSARNQPYIRTLEKVRYYRQESMYFCSTDDSFQGETSTSSY